MFPSNMCSDIAAFHEKFGLGYSGPPRVLPEELAQFRVGFIGEELGEYAFGPGSRGEELTQLMVSYLQRNTTPQNVPLEKQLDALVDMVYVILGNAYLQGFDFGEAWRRVHNANMQKVRAERAIDSARGSTYDVVKPAGWQAPDLSDLVNVA